MKAKLVKIDCQFFLYNAEDNLIATTEQSPYQRLSMKNCQAIERGYDLDELADEYIIVKPKYREHEHNMRADAFKEGFQKCLELMEHRLSEETEWDVEVEMELDVDTSKLFGAIYGRKSKLDADGCLILNRI